MTTYSTQTETEDRLAILDLIGRLVLVLDARDWDALGQLFTNTVYSDRTSLLGGEPVTVGRAEFVEGSRQTLRTPNTVHHMITCHVITLDGDRAACSANMMGTHVYTNHSGGPVWTVGGRHDYQAPADRDGWKIFRTDVQPPLVDRQHEHREPRGCRTTIVTRTSTRSSRLSQRRACTSGPVAWQRREPGVGDTRKPGLGAGDGTLIGPRLGFA